MNFKIELNIDWIDEDQNLDEAVKNAIISKLVHSIENKLAEQLTKDIASKANEVIDHKVSEIISNLLKKPITVNEGWNKQETYDSIEQMVEIKLSSLYDSKFGGNGCSEDPVLMKLKDHIAGESKRLVDRTEALIKEHATREAQRELKESQLFKALTTVLPEKELHKIAK